MNTGNDLNTVVAAAISEVQIGAVRRQEAVEEVGKFVNDHYIKLGDLDIARLGAMSVQTIAEVSQVLGLGFPAHDGVIAKMEMQEAV